MKQSQEFSEDYSSGYVRGFARANGVAILFSNRELAPIWRAAPRFALALIQLAFNSEVFL